MNTVNLEKARKNPAAVFGTPEAVYDATDLSDEQKREVLKQWKDQLQLEQTADDENMPAPGQAGSNTAEKLQRVTTVLQKLEK